MRFRVDSLVHHGFQIQGFAFLVHVVYHQFGGLQGVGFEGVFAAGDFFQSLAEVIGYVLAEIGRASCRERV